MAKGATTVAVTMYVIVVYTLWKWPHILGYITTWPPVLKKLQNGAGELHPHPFSTLVIIMYLFSSHVAWSGNA